MDQLYKICCVLGTPDWNAFPEARNISRLIDISYLNIMLVNRSDHASLEAIDLIEPNSNSVHGRMPTADQCLQHPFFHVIHFSSLSMS
nr:serine/threonine-protein kinase MHK isoform X1 [Ipomoea batatas]